jgi:Lrp/AsnC family transcriptional regulator, regulator for asnA, asnC and gidA
MLKFQKAFVLLQVDAGSAKNVADRLLDFDEVKEVHIITGEWDILAVIEAERQIVAPTDEAVLQVVLDKIDKVPHVRRSNTIIPSFSKSKS